MRQVALGLLLGLSVPGWGQVPGRVEVAAWAGAVAKLPDAPCPVAMPRMVIDRGQFPVVRERKPKGLVKNACGVALLPVEGEGRELPPK